MMRFLGRNDTLGRRFLNLDTINTDTWLLILLVFDRKQRDIDAPSELRPSGTRGERFVVARRLAPATMRIPLLCTHRLWPSADFLHMRLRASMCMRVNQTSPSVIDATSCACMHSALDHDQMDASAFSGAHAASSNSDGAPTLKSLLQGIVQQHAVGQLDNNPKALLQSVKVTTRCLSQVATASVSDLLALDGGPTRQDGQGSLWSYAASCASICVGGVVAFAHGGALPQKHNDVFFKNGRDLLAGMLSCMSQPTAMAALYFDSQRCLPHNGPKPSELCISTIVRLFCTLTPTASTIDLLADACLVFASPSYAAPFVAAAADCLASDCAGNDAGLLHAGTAGGAGRLSPQAEQQALSFLATLTKRLESLLAICPGFIVRGREVSALAKSVGCPLPDAADRCLLTAPAAASSSGASADADAEYAGAMRRRQATDALAHLYTSLMRLSDSASGVTRTSTLNACFFAFNYSYIPLLTPPPSVPYPHPAAATSAAAVDEDPGQRQAAAAAQAAALEAHSIMTDAWARPFFDRSQQPQLAPPPENSSSNSNNSSSSSRTNSIGAALFGRWVNEVCSAADRLMQVSRLLSTSSSASAAALAGGVAAPIDPDGRILPSSSSSSSSSSSTSSVPVPVAAPPIPATLQRETEGQMKLVRWMCTTGCKSLGMWLQASGGDGADAEADASAASASATAPAATSSTIAAAISKFFHMAVDFLDLAYGPHHHYAYQCITATPGTASGSSNSAFGGQSDDAAGAATGSSTATIVSVRPHQLQHDLRCDKPPSGASPVSALVSVISRLLSLGRSTASAGADGCTSNSHAAGTVQAAWGQLLDVLELHHGRAHVQLATGAAAAVSSSSSASAGTGGPAGSQPTLGALLLASQALAAVVVVASAQPTASGGHCTAYPRDAVTSIQQLMDLLPGLLSSSWHSIERNQRLIGAARMQALLAWRQEGVQQNGGAAAAAAAAAGSNSGATARRDDIAGVVGPSAVVVVNDAATDTISHLVQAAMVPALLLLLSQQQQHPQPRTTDDRDADAAPTGVTFAITWLLRCTLRPHPSCFDLGLRCTRLLLQSCPSTTTPVMKVLLQVLTKADQESHVEAAARALAALCPLQEQAVLTSVLKHVLSSRAEKEKDKGGAADRAFNKSASEIATAAASSSASTAMWNPPWPLVGPLPPSTLILFSSDRLLSPALALLRHLDPSDQATTNALRPFVPQLAASAASIVSGVLDIANVADNAHEQQMQPSGSVASGTSSIVGSIDIDVSVVSSHGDLLVKACEVLSACLRFPATMAPSSSSISTLAVPAAAPQQPPPVPVASSVLAAVTRLVRMVSADAASSYLLPSAAADGDVVMAVNDENTAPASLISSFRGQMHKKPRLAAADGALDGGVIITTPPAPTTSSFHDAGILVPILAQALLLSGRSLSMHADAGSAPGVFADDDHTQLMIASRAVLLMARGSGASVSAAEASASPSMILLLQRALHDYLCSLWHHVTKSATISNNFKRMKTLAGHVYPCLRTMFDVAPSASAAAAASSSSPLANAACARGGVSSSGSPSPTSSPLHSPPDHVALTWLAMDAGVQVLAMTTATASRRQAAGSAGGAAMAAAAAAIPDHSSGSNACSLPELPPLAATPDLVSMVLRRISSAVMVTDVQQIGVPEHLHGYFQGLLEAAATRRLFGAATTGGDGNAGTGTSSHRDGASTGPSAWRPLQLPVAANVSDTSAASGHPLPAHLGMLWQVSDIQAALLQPRARPCHSDA